jgi:hypothetical protein
VTTGRVAVGAAIIAGLLMAAPGGGASADAEGSPGKARLPSPGAAGAGLRAGVARVDITPDEPVALMGYHNPENRISEGVHDRLYARAIALGIGPKRVVLVSCDIASFLFGDYFVRLVSDRWMLQRDEIFLCATHTHSGPQLSLNAEYPHPNNARYTRKFERQIVEVVGRALGAMAPARMAVGKGRSPVGVSRRKPYPDGRVEMEPNPEGPSDDEVLVLRLSRATGAPFAILFDYASHSRSLRGTNRLVSGDILGIAEQVVERSATGGLLAAAFAGASGDVDPVRVVDGFNVLDGDTPVTVRLGTLLGEEAARASRTAADLPGPTHIRTASVRLALPPKSAGQSKSVGIVAAAVGNVAIVGLDTETSVELGLAIKKGSPFPVTFVVTNCNGTAGYLPTARQHTEGGYEVAMTGFGPGAGEVLVKETLSLLSRLR